MAWRLGGAVSGARLAAAGSCNGAAGCAWTAAANGGQLPVAAAKPRHCPAAVILFLLAARAAKALAQHQRPGKQGSSNGIAFKDLFENFLAGIPALETEPFRIAGQFINGMNAFVQIISTQPCKLYKKTGALSLQRTLRHRPGRPSQQGLSEASATRANARCRRGMASADASAPAAPSGTALEPHVVVHLGHAGNPGCRLDSGLHLLLAVDESA